MSKTKDALLLVEQGMTALEAARKVNLSPNALYVAIKKRKEAKASGLEQCPCCGSVVVKERINREVLK